jgi:hypothetical protein
VALALVKSLSYFAPVLGGFGSLVKIGCNMSVTWASLGTICRERDWSKHRLLHELQRGLPYRTIPAGHAIDWHSRDTVFAVEPSEVTYTKGVLDVEGVIGLDRPTVGIEVLPPTEGALAADEAADAASFAAQVITEGALAATESADLAAFSEGAAESPAPDLPAPPAKNVSEAALRECLLAIVRERPDDPLDEETLIDALEERLGAPVARDRVRRARKDYAADWVLPRGRPRKSAQ